jgi:hypothetical protein
MMAWKNVFESDFRLPDQVCIVAPGSNGVGHYQEIPPGFIVIVVSKAVLIPEVRPAIWMMNHVRQPWYGDADGAFHGIRVFSRDAATLADQIATTQGSKNDRYYFTPPNEPLTLREFLSVDGCIRIGATVSACAVQFAYNFGAREIVLCGVDMSGDRYFDGTVNENPYHGDTWPAAARLNVLVKWLIAERGLRITTISPTKLDVPPFLPPQR